MNSYKSTNNNNVIYIPLSVTSNPSDAGTKMVLRKVLTIQKRLNFYLFSIPYTRKVKELLYYWKPRRGKNKGGWLLLKKNFNNYKKDASNITIKHIVKSKRFFELLNKIEKNEKSNPNKSA